MKPFEGSTRRVAFRAGIIAFAAMMVLALSSLSAREVRGASPYIEIKNEPAPKLIMGPPLPDLLDQGVVWIQWRAENVHIVPMFRDAPDQYEGVVDTFV